MEREFRGCVFEFSIGFLQQRRILRPCAEAVVWRADDISPITLCTDRTSHVHTIPTDSLLAKHYAFLPHLFLNSFVRVEMELISVLFGSVGGASLKACATPVKRQERNSLTWMMLLSTILFCGFVSQRRIQ